jgi:hypothetical protein
MLPLWRQRVAIGVEWARDVETHRTTENRIRIAQALLVLAALSALAAALSDVATVVRAPAATAVVETWRLCGFVMFTGLFALLAAKPIGYRGLWELAIANKLMLTAIAVGYSVHGRIPGTAAVIGWDGTLSALLIAAYVLRHAALDTISHPA